MQASKFAEQAANGGYVGIPYSTLDCQAFVERVLKDCGISRNWRGSNHMWRNAVYSREPIGDMADIEPGEWLFNLKYDGGEKERGYNDDKGNAVHVGIYLGDCQVIHSSTGGVKIEKVSMQKWSHHAKAIDLSYDGAMKDVAEVDGYQLLDLWEAMMEAYDEFEAAINKYGGKSNEN